MAGQVSLDALIQSIAGAVIQAQDQIEQHQVANLGSYFDGDHRPRSLLLRVPSLNPTAGPGDEDFYRAPLLSLVPTNQLRIKDVRISFDANLGEIVAQAPEASGKAADSGDWPDTDGLPRATINVDPQAGPAGREFGAVRVTMRVESCEPPEGAARLLNHLAQTQGVTRTVNVA